MYDVNDILARLQKGETPEAIANECAKAINDAVALDKKNKEAAAAKEAEKEAKLNALAESMLKSILEYVKISAPEVAELLDDEVALDASEVRKTLDSIIPMVAAAANLAAVPIKKRDGTDSADAAISAFLDAFIN
jgi:DNA anti-recombination protein RmuC